MRLIDADALKEVIHSKSEGMEDLWDTAGVLNAINNSPTVAVNCKDCDGYEAGYSAGLKDAERPKGDCENCYYRNFTEKFMDGLVEGLNKYGITSIEQLAEILKGGADK